MRFRTGSDAADMLVALMVWFCTVPLVGLIVVPVFGIRIGIMAALGLFLVILAICWGLCSWRPGRR